MPKTITIILFCFLLLAHNAYSSDDYGSVNIHGFISQGYIKSSDHNAYDAETEDGTFQFNEMGLTFSTMLNDDLRLGLQFFARDLGTLGNDEIIIDWMYADYRYRNWLGVRVGKMKKPQGIYNMYREIDATRTCIFLPPSLYNELRRDPQLGIKGIGLYGNLLGQFNYHVMCGIFDLKTDSHVAQKTDNLLGTKTTGFEIENQNSCTITWDTPVSGLTLALNYSDWVFTYIMTEMPVWYLALGGTAPGEFEIDGRNIIGSIKYNIGYATLTAEYTLNKNIGTFKTLKNLVVTDAEREEYYVMLTYRINHLFEVGTYYSVSYFDKNHKDGKDVSFLQGTVFADFWLKDLAISLRFDINPFWVCKLEAHIMDGLEDIEYDEADPSRHWSMYAAKLSYSF